MSLKNWVQNGWLHTHKTSLNEIEELLKISDRDLNDCQTKGLSNDWRLAIAYNAGLQLAIAALAANGYRTSHEAHHYRAIQSLALTVGLDNNLVAEFDSFRKKRNISDYERAGLVSDQEVEEMIEFSLRLRKNVVQWLQEAHPDLFSK